MRLSGRFLDDHNHFTVSIRVNVTFFLSFSLNQKFFRRGLQEFETYSCKNDRMCAINPKTRNDCRYCRYQKCTEAGMSREGEFHSPTIIPFSVLFSSFLNPAAKTLH